MLFLSLRERIVHKAVYMLPNSHTQMEAMSITLLISNSKF